MSGPELFPKVLGNPQPLIEFGRGVSFNGKVRKLKLRIRPLGPNEEFADLSVEGLGHIVLPSFEGLSFVVIEESTMLGSEAVW